MGGGSRPRFMHPDCHPLEASLIKLQALDRFADDCGAEFHRMESLAQVNGKMRVFDLQQNRVRAGMVASDKLPLELYAGDYHPVT